MDRTKDLNSIDLPGRLSRRYQVGRVLIKNNQRTTVTLPSTPIVISAAAGTSEVVILLTGQRIQTRVCASDPPILERRILRPVTPPA